MKKISIVMSAYKSEDFIIEAINSIKNQTLPEGWTIDFKIGVDGCVATSKILKENQISFYFSNNNVGTYIITNTLLKKAYEEGSDIFVRFDSDDIASENFLYNGILNMEERDIIRSSFLQIDKNGKLIYQNPRLSGSYGCIFFNRKVLESVGGYYHHRVSCDRDFVRRAIASGYWISKSKYPCIYYYRRHSQSLTINKLTGSISDLRKSVEDQLNYNLSQGIYKIEPTTVDMEYLNF